MMLGTHPAMDKSDTNGSMVMDGRPTPETWGSGSTGTFGSVIKPLFTPRVQWCFSQQCPQISPARFTNSKTPKCGCYLRASLINPFQITSLSFFYCLKTDCSCRGTPVLSAHCWGCRQCHRHQLSRQVTGSTTELWWQKLRLEWRLSWFPGQTLHNHSFPANCTNGMFPGWISETSKGKANNGNHFRKTSSLPLWLQVHDFGISPDGGDLHNKKRQPASSCSREGVEQHRSWGRIFWLSALFLTYFKRCEIPKMVYLEGWTMSWSSRAIMPAKWHSLQTHTVSQGSNLNSKHEDIPLHVQKTKDKNLVLWLPIAIKINCHIKLLILTKWSYTIYQLKDRANSLVV